MLNLKIDAKGVDYCELLSIVDEIKKHLENEITYANDIREDKSGEYELTVSGSEEITPERFKDQIERMDATKFLYYANPDFDDKKALFYCSTLSEFLIENKKRSSFIEIICDLDINEELMKKFVYDKLFKDLDFELKDDMTDAIQEIELNHSDELLQAKEDVYREILGKKVLETADLEDFVRKHPKEASDYAIEKDWL